jgi:hypothetical protein
MDELQELRDFAIKTKKDLRILLQKHRREILEIDCSPIDPYHQRLWREQLGEKEYARLKRQRIWFTYPGLLRLALDLEFGEKYEKYSDKRDGI